MTVTVNKIFTIVMYLLQIPLNIQTLLYSGLHSLMDLVLINEIESPVKDLRSDVLGLNVGTNDLQTAEPLAPLLFVCLETLNKIFKLSLFLN